MNVAKVLVIDDSRMMLVYLRRSLEKGGFEVETWVPMSAMEIPGKLTESAPDLVLTDYQMPGCNGTSVARMVGKASPGLPVLVLTAFRDAEMEANLLKLGVKQVLSKPISSDLLLKAVGETLAAPRAEAAS